MKESKEINKNVDWSELRVMLFGKEIKGIKGLDYPINKNNKQS